jgi:hypothetical protein
MNRNGVVQDASNRIRIARSNIMQLSDTETTEICDETNTECDLCGRDNKNGISLTGVSDNSKLIRKLKYSLTEVDGVPYGQANSHVTTRIQVSIRAE